MKELFEIHITSHGRYIGKMSTDEFRAAAHAPRTMFLHEAIEKFNEWKNRIGEPERAEMVILPSRKGRSSKRTSSLRRASKRSKSKRGFRRRRAMKSRNRRVRMSVRRRGVMSLPKVSALRWFKVFTERNPQGTFVQARSNVEAADKAERDGRGRVLRVEYAQE